MKNDQLSSVYLPPLRPPARRAHPSWPVGEGGEELPPLPPPRPPARRAHPSRGVGPPGRWADTDFPRVSDKASPSYKSDTLVIAVTTAINIEGEGGDGGEVSYLSDKASPT